MAVVDIHVTGILTITDAPNNGMGPFTLVSFKIFIKKNKGLLAVPFPDFNNKNLFEVDMEAVLKHCSIGDLLLKFIRSIKLQVCTSARLTQNPC